MSPRILFGLALATSLDLSLGIAITGMMAMQFGRRIELWYFLAGILLSVLPDVDSLFERLRKGGVTGEHKKGSVTHYPLLAITVAFVLIFLFSPFWALIAVVILLAHYVEDSIVTGPGIAWLAPFKYQHYWLFWVKEGRFYVVLPLTPDELQKQYARTVTDWLEQDYFRLNIKTFFGPLALLGAVMLVILL